MKISELQTVVELQRAREDLEEFIERIGSKIQVDLAWDHVRRIYVLEIHKHPIAGDYKPDILTRLLGPMISAAITATATEVYEEIVEKYGVEPG